MVLLQEPASKYLDHLTLENKTGEGTANSIMEFLETNMIVISQLKSVGCDGPVVNTG